MNHQAHVVFQTPFANAVIQVNNYDASMVTVTYSKKLKYTSYTTAGVISINLPKIIMYILWCT